MTIRPRPPR